MPAYVSHTIMAHDVYDKLKNKNVSLDYMLTFSLGGDLTKFAKCRYDTHHKKEEEFIFAMVNYIKEHKLSFDGDVIGVLYGHICHYIMDKTLHPLVYKISKECVKDKRNHTIIEGCIDNYLVNYKYHFMVDKYDNKMIFKGRVNEKIKRMLNAIYLEVYNTKRISWYYKFNLWLYKKIKYLYKIFGINGLKKISGYNKFIINNKTFNLGDTDLMKLYEDSVSKAYEYILKIDKKL